MTKTIERINAALPQYNNFLQFMRSPNNKMTPRLQSSLINFYVDLFEFFRATSRVFSTHEGSEYIWRFTAEDLMACRAATNFH
jgi:hypothetical protein